MAAICLAAAGDCPDALAPAGDDALGIGGITTPGTTHLTTQARNHFATPGSTPVGTVGASTPHESFLLAPKSTVRLVYSASPLRFITGELLRSGVTIGGVQ